MVTGGKYANDVYVFTIMKQTRYGTEYIVQTYLLREKKSSPEITDKQIYRQIHISGRNSQETTRGGAGRSGGLFFMITFHSMRKKVY